jgi:DNA/RNA-binding protein KIN17
MSLGKHKFYCEMCRKQCKDDNAFQQHKRSSQHQQNMLDFNEDPAFFIERFSKEV